MPLTISDAYEEAILRVETQDPECVNLANQVFGWISYAKQLLTSTELQHALAVNTSSTDFDEDGLIDDEFLISVCAGLVMIDQNSGIIRYIHTTALEHFQNICMRQFPDAQNTIAITCLTYLGFAGFDGPCHDRKSMDKRLQKYEFSRYAAQFWGSHTRDAEKCDDVQKAALALLSHKTNRDSMLQMKQYVVSNGDISFTEGQTILHVIAEEGLATICSIILGEFLNEEERYLMSLLRFTKRIQQVDHAPVFRDNKQAVATKDEEGQTALHRAARGGHEKVVDILLKAGADATIPDKGGRTALYWAKRGGHDKMFDMLLKAGADVATQDRDELASGTFFTTWDWIADNFYGINESTMLLGRGFYGEVFEVCTI